MTVRSFFPKILNRLIIFVTVTGITFPKVWAGSNRIGITKVMIEWKDYQSESFGELIFRDLPHSSPFDRESLPFKEKSDFYPA